MLRRVCWLLLLSTVAFAQAPTPRSLFDEGTALYAKGDFAEAARKFEASFAARPVPVTKFNIARAWEQAGETLKAIDAWQAWLVMSPASPDRATAQQSLQALGAKLAKLGVQALTITSLPTGGRVSIDGVAVGVTPLTVELTPSRHLLRVDVEGRVPIERPYLMQLERPAVETFDLPALDNVATGPVPLTRPTPLPIPTVPRPTDPEFTPALAEDTVRVHLVAENKEVRLYRANGNPNGECRAPCDVAVSRATDLFAVSGEGMVASSPFVLLDHASRGQVTIRVKRAGSAGWLVGGGTLFTTMAVAGLSIALAFAISPGSQDRSLPIGLGLALGVGGGLGAGLCFGLNTTQLTFE